jgi:CDP-diacylglycerol pyrophosphatase
MRNPTVRLRRTAAVFVIGLAAALIAIAGRLTLAPARAADSNALWHVVHDLCVTDMKLRRGPAPCLAVDLQGGYAILKDIRGATQILLVPTVRLTGIESPRLLQPASPNYFDDAWNSRRFFERRTGVAVPRDDIALAINSRYARTQSQLHIHIDCVRPDVRDALRANENAIGYRWTDFPQALHNRRYRAMRVIGEDLGSRDPFKLLARGDPQAGADMQAETLAVIGETFPGGQPGFVLLSDRADLLRIDPASGEDLLDHSCAVLRPAAATGAAR